MVSKLSWMECLFTEVGLLVKKKIKVLSGRAEAENLNPSEGKPAFMGCTQPEPMRVPEIDEGVRVHAFMPWLSSVNRPESTDWKAESVPMTNILQAVAHI
ncbi:MAG: hypothetical protein H7293_03125 [Candidatus Saccharibacteria bacterium]|nr:hypothetical protein [Rhodoferax sp.]